MTINKYAIEVFHEEARAILKLVDYLDYSFSNIVQEILNSNGRVIVTGVGKSGIIGKKISSSLASTGTPSFFLHPAEAFHGDLGMIQSEDIILAIANSGETNEILKLIPFIKDNKNLLISITGNPDSTLSKYSDYNLNIRVEKEVCPFNLAPTTSAVTTLAMGDALTIALMKERDFKPLDYARYHPGGSLGRSLLIKAKDLMQNENLPIISKEAKINNVLLEISNARLGIAVVLENDTILGVVTDGDIRREMEKRSQSFFNIRAIDIMNENPIKVDSKCSVIEVEEIMRSKKIQALLVVSNNNKLQGIINYYDIFKNK